MRSGLAVVLAAGLAASASAAPRPKARPKAEPPPPPAAPLHPPRVSTEPITFIWPPEGLPLAASSEFIFGNVEDPKARFTINGQTVTVHKDGGFLAYLPVSPGTFTFTASLELPSGTTTAARSILVASPPPPLPDDKTAIDKGSLLPRAELELRPGDWWTARMRGTKGLRGRARLPGGKWRDMREVPPGGVYELSAQVAPGEEFGPGPIEYELGSGWSSESAASPANLSASGRALGVATVKALPGGYANMRTGPANGFLLFPQSGTRLVVTGREGGSLRAALGPSLSGWIDAKDVELSTSAAPPRVVVGDIGVVHSSAAGTSALRINLAERVPFDVTVDDDLGGLTLRIFYAAGHTNWITHEGDSDFVEQVRWRQEQSDVVAVRVKLKPGRRLWGWNGRYDYGASLKLDMRRAPRIDPARPLAGLRVMLDPGHMPSAPGSIGPLGTKEMDANFALAEAMAVRLQKEGAVVLITRASSTHELGLAERPRLALERAADVFVSVHNNALPDGANPFAKPRGFTVFYYHPQSLALGRALHAAYRERLPLPDEGLQWGNLLVARLSAAPAVLLENAYMMLPEQEALLNDPRFRGRVADAATAGLRAFAKAAAERR